MAENKLKMFFGYYDYGAVTAEFSVVLPAAIVVALILLGVGRTVVCSMNCHDAARQVAYHLVAYNDGTSLEDIVHRVAGSDASLKLKKYGNNVDISVSCPVIPDPMHVLPTVVHSDIKQIVT